jgi:alpha-tubulin suppressor-like RCC1 family protein
MFVNNTAYAQKIYTGGNTNTIYGIDVSGNLYAWGKNSNGQVGDGTINNALTPLHITFPTGVTQWLKISGGGTYVLAIGNDNNLYAWGQNNYGQLGQGSSSATNILAPTIISKPTGVTSWTAISAGNGHSIALGDDGNVYTWGYNSFGQIGNGTNSITVFQLTLFKVPLPGSVTAKAITATDNASFAIGSDNVIYTWGRNANGQLGNNTTTDSYIPVAVNLPSTPVTISSGTFFVVVLCSDGNLYAWGQNNNGQCGDGTLVQRLTPGAVIKPTGVVSWTSIACGASFLLGIANNGSLYGCGLNDASFELGVATGVSNNPSPVNIVFPSGVVPVSVAAAHNSGFIVDANNNVYGWGQNTLGQVGINTIVNQATPTQVLGVGGTGFLVLPVELTSFTSSIKSSGVNLQWITATEINNSGFDVERAVDNVNFEKIGFVKGSGNSNSPNQYSFIDKNNLSGNIKYRLKQIDNNGTYRYSQVIEVNKLNEPTSYKLGNYPNPFNPSTIIRFELPENTFVNITVYNMLGKRVATLINQKMEKGIHEINFNPQGLATGIYVYQMNAGSKVITQKMTLLK